MTFKKGESGNPEGRPKGIKDRRTIFRELVEPHKTELIEKAINMALGGDGQMLTLLLSRLMPSKPKDDPLPEIGCLGESFSEQGRKIISLISSGIITPAEGNSLLAAIATQATLVEADDLIKRIEKLEAFKHE